MTYTPLKEVSVDFAAALAMEFVRGSCSDQDVAEAAKAAGVGTLVFRPGRRRAVWEELFCASAGLAAHSITHTRSERTAIKIAGAVFELEFFREASKLIGQSDKATNARVAEKMRAYKSALLAGQDAVGLSMLFVEHLRAVIDGFNRRDGLALIPVIASMQIAMREEMSRYKIRYDEDDD